MYDIIDSILNMKMDIYVQQDSQDETTGAIKKSWMFYKTIPCHAKGVISNSATSRSGDKQIIGNKYSNEQILEIRTSEKITYREKITNVRDSSNTVIWNELNFPTESPTVFEVISSTPVTDPFGGVLGYNSVAKRSENQQIGI
jgi:hypothetical protein